MSIICLNKFGNFDVEYTHSLWKSPLSMPYIECQKICNEIFKLCEYNDDEQIAIKYLKSNGFTNIKPITVTIGSGL